MKIYIRFFFSIQQAASDLTITESELTKKAVCGLRQGLRGHGYMRKPKTMEELRQEARLVERVLSMSNPMGEDITATIQASVNAAMASMQQLLTPVAAMEPNPPTESPTHPPSQKQQQPVQNQQDSRRESVCVCVCALNVVSPVFQNLIVELKERKMLLLRQRGSPSTCM